MLPRLLTAMIAASFVTMPNAWASTGTDPVEEPSGNTAYPSTTCHSGSLLDPNECTTGNSEMGLFSFHSDVAGDQTSTVWARSDSTGRVVYWQCIFGGLYSGDPSSGAFQGSFAGGTTADPFMLGDFDPATSGYYTFEWYEGCWRPCDELHDVEESSDCVVIEAFTTGSGNGHP